MFDRVFVESAKQKDAREYFVRNMNQRGKKKAFQLERL